MKGAYVPNHACMRPLFRDVHTRLLISLARAGHGSRDLCGTRPPPPPRCPLKAALASLEHDELDALETLVAARAASDMPLHHGPFAPYPPVRRLLEPLIAPRSTGHPRSLGEWSKGALESRINSADDEAFHVLVAALADEKTTRADRARAREAKGSR